MSQIYHFKNSAKSLTFPSGNVWNELMPEIRCQSCRICAYDAAAPLFGSAYLMVSDDECSYFVAGGEYMLKCQYVRGRRDGFTSVTDNPCPRLKKAVASNWRAPLRV
jgi:hypothetical protein